MAGGLLSTEICTVLTAQFIRPPRSAAESRFARDGTGIDHSKRRTGGDVLANRRLHLMVQHLLKALTVFQENNVEFISLTESIDTSTPYGKMVFTVLGAVAELERAHYGAY
jgi:hypothetical protein